jgi:hypothetical protein
MIRKTINILVCGPARDDDGGWQTNKFENNWSIKTMELAKNDNTNGYEYNPLLNGQAHEYPPPNKSPIGIINKASFFLPKAGVVTNIGSTARDHLANERTYLVWTRTSLALIGASIGLLKWDAFSSVEGYLVGLTGVVALITSTYMNNRCQITCKVVGLATTL